MVTGHGYSHAGTALEISGISGAPVRAASSTINQTLTLIAPHSGDVAVFSCWGYGTVVFSAAGSYPASGWVVTSGQSGPCMAAIVCPTTGGTVTATFTGATTGGAVVAGVWA